MHGHHDREPRAPSAVIDRGTLIGLVSIGDLVKDIISEQQFIIEQLEHYITGSHS